MTRPGTLDFILDQFGTDRVGCENGKGNEEQGIHNMLQGLIEYDPSQAESIQGNPEVLVTQGRHEYIEKSIAPSMIDPMKYGLIHL